MKKLLKFWGTRGSCPVSGPEYRHFGGNTCCVEVRYGDHLIILDAGTGIRPLGLTLGNEKKIDLFLSHTHLDHLIGFPFFEPLYKKGVHIAIWAPHGPNRSCRELLIDLLSRDFFPIHLDELQTHLEFHTIEEKKSIQIGPLTLNFHSTRHPGPTYSFQIKTPHQIIGYVTDNEIDIPSQKNFIEFYKGCDLFVHEAQYTPEEYKHKKGWGHSPLFTTLALVEQVRPKQWLVTHHDPKHTDADLHALEKLAQTKSPCPVEWLPDGYVLALK